jgi:hypothetical protein
MKKVGLAIGALAAALGGLWFLQGLGIVHVRPILCFADCAPLQGPSQTWAIIGFFMIVAGALAIVYSVKPRS